MPSIETAPALRRLILSDFRSYAALDLAIDATIIVVSGENGSGKTNLLEAISMFAQGAGFGAPISRRARGAAARAASRSRSN